MSKIGIVFPHQLVEQNILANTCDTIYLVEEYLYFKHYNFHKKKIAFHRASMKFYENYLQSKNSKVVYIESFDELSDITKLIPYLKNKGVQSFEYIDTTDYWLEKRITNTCKESDIHPIKRPTPLFLNTSEELASFFATKKRMFQTEFYKHQRLTKNILLEKQDKPIGGKWTFDDENRLKYPKGKTVPKTTFLKPNAFYSEAIAYTEKHFSNNYGELNTNFIYPTIYAESKSWLAEFFKTRFSEFGA